MNGISCCMDLIPLCQSPGWRKGILWDLQVGKPYLYCSTPHIYSRKNPCPHTYMVACKLLVMMVSHGNAASMELGGKRLVVTA